MVDRWSRERVLALAQDRSARRAAEAAADPTAWHTTGADGLTVWGAHQGSATDPYQVCARLDELAHDCSCPSRKSPCKHVLALLLLWAAGAVPPATAVPDRVAERLRRPAPPARTVRNIRHPLAFRVLSVRANNRITPRTARITLTGPELVGLRTLAPDDYVRLFFPRPGEERPVIPRLGRDGVRFPADRPRPAFRDYTVRRFDPLAPELDIDFVLHDGDGPACSWARRAEPGDLVGVGGPGGSSVVPDDFACYLLAGDETALPAIARRLAELPPGSTATVFVEVENAGEEQPLPSAAHTEIAWLHRDGRAPTPLADAVRSAPLPAEGAYFWAAGEAGALRPLRRHVTGDPRIALAKLRGYWKRGTPGWKGKVN